MNGSLPQELEKRIHDWVAEGKYGSVDEALTAAVQVLHDRELSREGNEWLTRISHQPAALASAGW